MRRPWWWTFSWKWRMINSDTWWPFGKMTGCFSWYSSVEFSRRPPTRSSPLQSTKGSSCNRFEYFGNWFLHFSWWHHLKLCRENFFVYCLDCGPASLFEFGCRRRRPRDDWLFWERLIPLLELSYERNTTWNCAPQGGPAGKALESLAVKTVGWVCCSGTGDDFSPPGRFH